LNPIAALRERIQSDPNFLTYLLLAAMITLMIGSRYAVPEQYQAHVFIGGYIVLFIIIILQSYIAMIKVAPYKHLSVIFKTADGNAVRRHLYLPPDVSSSTIQERQVKDKKRHRFYSFRLKPVRPIKLPGFSKVSELLVLSKLNFDDSFKFRPRKNAAFYMGTVCDHPASDSCVMLLFPHPHDEFQRKIPIALLAEASGYTWDLLDKWRNEIDTDMIISTQVEELHEQIVKLDGENAILRAQLAGKIDEHKNIKEIQADTLISIATSQKEIERALMKPRTIYEWKWSIILGGALAAIGGYYLYANPQSLAYLHAILNQYSPIIIGLLALAFIVILFLSIKKRR